MIGKVRKACYSGNEFGVVQAVTKKFTRADMTDGTDATGYIDFPTGSLPANSILLGWSSKTNTAFVGNSSAAIQVGIAGTVGKYSTTTSGSCYTAITVGSGIPEAVVYQLAAATPRVTITGGSDFTAITAGQTTVSIYYIAAG